MKENRWNLPRSIVLSGREKELQFFFPRLKTLWNSLQIPVLKDPRKGLLTESFVEPEG